jgi:hypothetical protein
MIEKLAKVGVTGFNYALRAFFADARAVIRHARRELTQGRKQPDKLYRRSGALTRLE